MTTGENDSSGQTPPNNTVFCAAVSIKPPQFSKENPRGWFACIESQFALSKITEESTKFRHVVAALPPQINDTFQHITCKAQFEAGDYTTLKDDIIRIFGESKTRRLNQVLDTEQMGDRTPSQFYMALQAKTTDLALTPEVLRNRWLKKLPSSVQIPVATMQTQLAIADLLKLADEIYEHSTDAHVAAIKHTPDNKYQRQRSNSFSRHGTSKGPKKGFPGKKRHNARNNGYTPDGPYCWYHYTFKGDAQKCAGGDCLFQKPKNARQ